jgi:type IX secretion system PorP/SprF family membrane protein
MFRRLIIYTAAALMLLGGSEAYGQDPHFSQFYANPMYLNPAFAGSAICPRLIMNYRNQWPSIPGSFVTYNASYDQYFGKIRGGLALLAMSDRQGEGALTTQGLAGIYSVRIKLSREWAMNFGAQARFVNKFIDWDKLTFGDMIDSRQGFIYLTQESQGRISHTFTDFSAGLLFFNERMFFGFAADHLAEPDEGFNNASILPRKYTAHAGIQIPLDIGSGGYLSTPTILSPNFIYQKQWFYHQTNYGLYVNKEPFIGGIWFRHFVNKKEDIARYQESLIFLLGFQYDKFKFGYSYDWTISTLTNATGGAHEFSFTLNMNCPTPSRKFRKIVCPHF